VALVLSAPAQAQTRGWLDNNQSYSAPAQASFYDSQRTAYDNGFREGLKEGEKDGRKNDRFAYQDEKSFQRADKGYHREYGPLDRYRQSFRTGYAAGYSDGYRRYAPNNGSNGRYGDGRYGDGRYGDGRYGDGRYGDGRYGDGRYGDGRYGDGRAVPRGNPRRPDIYPGYPGYPSSDRSYGRYGGYSTEAVQNGVNDGYEKGVEDARKNRSYDPLRHAWYRSGDRHYNSRVGSREQYKDLYRQGFRDGYDRGFREGRYR
jgi:flagellar biosynthesis/type III secretory pathway protein FliH